MSFLAIIVWLAILAVAGFGLYSANAEANRHGPR